MGFHDIDDGCRTPILHFTGNPFSQRHYIHLAEMKSGIESVLSGVRRWMASKESQDDMAPSWRVVFSLKE